MCFFSLCGYQYELGIFAQKRSNLAGFGIFGHFGPGLAGSFSAPVGGLVGGCGAWAVSRKTPSYFMIICVLKRILHKKKVTFIQLQESPFLLTACCYSVTMWSDSGVAEALRT